MSTLLLIVAAYLLGSIPFAIVTSRLFGLEDPRKYGSGNPGATNVLRSGNKAAAVLTLLGDALKGATQPDEKQAKALELGADAAFPSGERLPERVDAVMETIGAATWSKSSMPM